MGNLLRKAAFDQDFTGDVNVPHTAQQKYYSPNTIMTTPTEHTKEQLHQRRFFSNTETAMG